MKEYDVIVSGCGPVGLIAAHLLGHFGLSTLVIDKEREPYNLPRAIHFDHEVMRIFQSVGLADRILPLLSTPAGTMFFGAKRTVIRQFQPMVHTKRLGWASAYFFYQPDLERMVREELESYDSVDTKLGYSLVSIVQDEEFVTAHCSDGEQKLSAKARYLLGCDGARSTVRNHLSIGLTDLGFHENWVVADVLVDGKISLPELHGTPSDVDMQDVMFIIGDPARPTSVIPGTGRHRRWEFMILPGEDPEAFIATNKIVELIGPWVGDQSHKIVRCATHVFHALLAERWREGRVFLLGDAAHQTPPFYGQGMCHGIRDAANLAWKLKMVLDGKADDSLLETYQVERLPQVRSVVEAAVKTGRYLCTIDPALAERRDEELSRIADQTAPKYVDIIPPLLTGLVSQRTEPSARGSRFIQPPMVDSTGARRLLDDFTGADGFVILSRISATNVLAMAPTNWNMDLIRVFTIIDRNGLSEAAERRLWDVSGEIFSWFDENCCDSVIVRPDHYVYGTAKGDDELYSLMDELMMTLAVTRITA